MDTLTSPVLRNDGGIGRLLGNDRSTAAARPMVAVERDLRLDFFRGLSLLFIFIDHIPNNFLSYVTLHSIAFSDAAEVFVFISGYAAALAYGHLFHSKGLPIATVHVYHRIWHLYVAHIFIFAVYAAMPRSIDRRELANDQGKDNGESSTCRAAGCIAQDGDAHFLGCRMFRGARRNRWRCAGVGQSAWCRFSRHRPRSALHRDVQVG
jgi:hypothetical protein